jgi:hypothetical protein
LIDKFNFYDIYGYFLPGATLLLLLWLPFGLVRNFWPASDFGSAVIGVVLAYVSGHLLQMFATKVIPSSKSRGSDGHDRYPSEVVLDTGSSNLTTDFKTNLAKLVKKKFDLDLGIDKTASPEIDKARRDAFFLARHVLIRVKEISYAEQFQAMYALMRGLSVVFALTFVYYAGWSLSVFSARWSKCTAVIVTTISLLVAINLAAQLLREDLGRDILSKLERIGASFLLIAAVGIGFGLGRQYSVTAVQAGSLSLFAAVALLGCLRCYGAYKFFGNNFAITVWRDFFASTDKEQALTDNLST